MGRLMTSKRRFIVCCVGELVGETAVFACQSNKSRIYHTDYEHLLREMIFLLDLLLKECMLYLSNFYSLLSWPLLHSKRKFSFLEKV